MEARYLRVKNWADKQHYKDRMPPWIKLYNTIIGTDDRFGFLPEHEQWQLVRLWLIASRASAFALDDDGRRVPVIPDDELALRRSIQTVKKIPLAKFIREGWLLPVDASEVLADDASADASALLGTEVHKDPSDALTSHETSEEHLVRESVERSLEAVA